jgi:signal transduction histidine kinase
MKLRLKIFLSILLVSLTTLLISNIILINKSHLANIEREQERSLNEFELIKLSILNSITLDSTTDALKNIAGRYADYYEQKGIYLILYHNNSYLNNFLNIFQENDLNKLTTVSVNQKKVHVVKKNSDYYFYVSGLLDDNDNSVLIYARNITGIYTAKKQSVHLSAIVAFSFILLLSIFSYIYSKWITKPIQILQQGALAISSGDYNIRINESKDEFNVLASAFNQMAQAIENRTYELEEKARERQQFIDDLSHEMNTPLTSIGGFSEFLLSANATDEQRYKSTLSILTEAKRMKDIYTKLMTLTYAREHNLELHNVLVTDLLEDIRTTHEKILQDHNISLVTKNEIDSLTIDKTFIHMLLSNLIKNSMQAMQMGGTIKIQVYHKDNRPVIEVVDNGCGIPKDKLEDVMKPFFRVDKSRSRKTGGAGLGLSICKDIAILHNAELVISSTVGSGTSIKVIF